MKFTISYTLGAVKVLRVTLHRERALQLATDIATHASSVVVSRGTRPIFSQQFFNNVVAKPRITPSPTFARSVRYVR